jgi:hypothetical protein
MREINNSGLSQSDVVRAFGTLMGTDMLTESGNPTPWARFNSVVDTGLSVSEYLQLLESGSSAVDQYLRYHDAGVERRIASEVARAMADLDPEGNRPGVTNRQRIRTVFDVLEGNVSDAQLLRALSVHMSEGEFVGTIVAASYGIAPRQYVQGLEYLVGIMTAQGRTSRRNADVTHAVNMMDGLSATQRAALWQMIAPTTSSRNNPFNRSTGTQASRRAEQTREFVRMEFGYEEPEQRHDGGAGLMWAGMPGDTAQAASGR